MPFPTALPTSRVPDSQDAPPLRWGVIGTGWIAERFVDALHRHTHQQVVAVGSRTPGTATRFAERLGLPTAHGSYSALVEDPQVDVVYVATPHPAHHPLALLALRAGKHTLVEKPLALNAAQAREIADEAHRGGLFCMEAMWSFFLPRFDVVRQVLDAGLLGERKAVIADHGEHFGPEHRIMRADLAGGPLLDLGFYPVALALAVLGQPITVTAIGSPAPGSGVNGQTAVLLGHDQGRQSALHCTILADTPTGATIAGTEGTLTLPGPFFSPGDVVLSPAGSQSAPLTRTELLIGHQGLHYQAAEVARLIAAGRVGSDRRPLADSIATLTVIDEIRRQIGVIFEAETLEPLEPQRST